MKLERLSLTNFRPFYGAQELIFDHTSTKNVHIVFGANGAGKTTLLNAMTWVLYQELSGDFEQPGRLINDRAWEECKDGSTVDAMVELEFLHGSTRYIVKRVHRVRKEGEKQTVMIEGKSSLHVIARVANLLSPRTLPMLSIKYYLNVCIHFSFLTENASSVLFKMVPSKKSRRLSRFY